MQLYNLLIPTHSNDGRSFADEHKDFKIALLNLAGGYTRQPAGTQGFWKDEGGSIIRDDLVSYTVAVPPAVISAILDQAHSLFTDQTAIYVSEVGTYSLSYRGKGRASPIDVPTADRPPQDMVDGWFDTEGGKLPREETEAIARVVTREARTIRAAELAKLLREHAREWSDAAWAVDTAASKLRKAKAGYRSAAILGDSPWDIPSLEKELADAINAGEGLIFPDA